MTQSLFRCVYVVNTDVELAPEVLWLHYHKILNMYCIGSALEETLDPFGIDTSSMAPVAIGTGISPMSGTRAPIATIFCQLGKEMVHV